MDLMMMMTTTTISGMKYPTQHVYELPVPRTPLIAKQLPFPSLPTSPYANKLEAHPLALAL